jgi:predicted DNA-binding transcriptional regulator AlpA
MPNIDSFGLDPNLRAKDAAGYVGIGTSTFFAWVAQGKMPPGVRLGRRCTVWKRSSLDKALREIAEETEKTAPPVYPKRTRKAKDAAVAAGK